MKQGDFVIYDGKHFAKIEGTHGEGKKLEFRIEYTTNDNTWNSRWVKPKTCAPIPENLATLPENASLKIRLLAAQQEIDRIKAEQNGDYTHCYVVYCETCFGVCAAHVDDESQALSNILAEWDRDERSYALLKLPVKMSCTCPYVPEEEIEVQRQLL